VFGVDPDHPNSKGGPSAYRDPDFVQAKPGIGHNSIGRLTREQQNLVYNHLPKIKKEAKKYCGGDSILRDELVNVGIDLAYKLVRLS
jgi:hypothetical protein